MMPSNPVSLLAEQERIVQNYIGEACAVKQSFASVHSCDINLSTPKLDIPMVPCNFIPIQPQLYTGKDPATIGTVHNTSNSGGIK